MMFLCRMAVTSNSLKLRKLIIPPTPVLRHLNLASDPVLDPISVLLHELHHVVWCRPRIRGRANYHLPMVCDMKRPIAGAGLRKDNDHLEMIPLALSLFPVCSVAVVAGREHRFMFKWHIRK